MKLRKLRGLYLFWKHILPQTTDKTLGIIVAIIQYYVYIIVKLSFEVDVNKQVTNNEVMARFK